jgi:hypothetical protein
MNLLARLAAVPAIALVTAATVALQARWPSTGTEPPGASSQPRRNAGS